MTDPQDVPHSNQALVRANDIEICYDSFGDPTLPPLLLIAGLGAQLVSWDEEFCKQLASCGYRVIRFDNRDVGFTTSFHWAGIPNIPELVEARSSGEIIPPPYTLTDMAEDAVGLLDALEIHVTHVLGVSMGGMIAQLVAIRNPDRVRTLTSIMSTTGDPGLPPPKPEALAILLRPIPHGQAAYIDGAVQAAQVFCGPEFTVDEDRVRARAAQSYNRDPYPTGAARQLAAVLAAGSRRKALKSVTSPTLVIHGDADPLIPLECGVDTAEAVPGARLRIMTGMGHDLPPALWPKLLAIVAQHAR